MHLPDERVIYQLTTLYTLQATSTTTSSPETTMGSTAVTVRSSSSRTTSGWTREARRSTLLMEATWWLPETLSPVTRRTAPLPGRSRLLLTRSLWDRLPPRSLRLLQVRARLRTERSCNEQSARVCAFVVLTMQLLLNHNSSFLWLECSFIWRLCARCSRRIFR